MGVPGGTTTIDSEDGQSIGQVILGPQTEGILVYGISNAPPSDAIYSASVEINLFDKNGNPVTQLDDPIEICLTASSCREVHFYLNFIFGKFCLIIFII